MKGLKAIGSTRKSPLMLVMSCAVVSVLILFGAACVAPYAKLTGLGVGETVRPPCAPVAGSDRDPCEISEVSNSGTGRNLAGYSLTAPPLPFNPEWLYRAEWEQGGHRTPQIVVRGVVALNSARCSEVGAYNFGDGDNGIVSAESASALVVCHVEVDVSEYLIGSGPSRIPVVASWRAFVSRSSPGFGSAAYFDEFAAPIRDALEGYEYVIELALPPNMAWGEWRMVHSWSLQRLTDGTIVASAAMSAAFSGTTDAEDWEIPLDELVPKLKVAHATVAAEYGGRISDEPGSPMLVTDASRESLLGQLRTLGAYDVPGITPVPAPPAPIPPVEPGDLTASPPNEAGGIPLSWTAPDSGMVSGYKVVRRVPKGEFVTVVADTGSTDTTYTDTSAPMTAGVTYIYRVLALNEYGESLASNRATVELPGPDAPTDFTATNYEGDVVLTWTQPGVIMPSCFRIYRRAQGEQSFEWIVNCWSAELRYYNDDDVVSGTRYIYRIVPMIGYTESGATARASVRVR